MDSLMKSGYRDMHRYIPMYIYVHMHLGIHVLRSEVFCACLWTPQRLAKPHSSEMHAAPLTSVSIPDKH